MNLTIPLPILLGLFAGGGALYLIYLWARSIRQSAGRIESAAADFSKAVYRMEQPLFALTIALTKASETLAPASAEVQANIAALPKLMESVARVGQGQLDFLNAQRADAQQQSVNPFGRRNGPFAPRDTAAANQEDEISQIMRSEGVSREEALMRMNTANTGSVWGGDQMFSDWRNS